MFCLTGVLEDVYITILATSLNIPNIISFSSFRNLLKWSNCHNPVLFISCYHLDLWANKIGENVILKVSHKAMLFC